MTRIRRGFWMMVAAAAMAAPGSSGVTAAPVEVTNLRLSGGAQTLLEWDPVPGATGYDVLVSSSPMLDLGNEFLAFDQTDIFVYDTRGPQPEPPTGPIPCFFYLVRARVGATVHTWGFQSSGVERLADDADRDGIADAVDNCPAFFNTLQSDTDVDGPGDECDNCPAQPNPGQQDGNGDGGGDACAPPTDIPFFGPNFEPEPGLDPALMDPQLPHPAMNGVVHPVIQLTRDLREPQLDALAALGVSLHEAIDHNVIMAAVRQSDLPSLAALPFVRAVFPLPQASRVGPPGGCDPLEHGSWMPLQTNTNPSARASHAMADDVARGRGVLFGGDADGGPSTSNLDDTWEWDGMGWTMMLPATVPEARSDHAMAWDEARGVTVMFGGLTDDPNGGMPALSDATWVWDGADWVRKMPANAPAPRSGHAMAYDRARQQVVLFGGVGAGGQLLNDTWIWDGADWRQVMLAGAPQPCFNAAMGWDQGMRRVVLFGGEGANGPTAGSWAWDGSTWVQLELPESPTARSGHAIASRWDSCGIVLNGGAGPGGQLLGDTWFYNGRTWLPVAGAPAPTPRAHHALIRRLDSGRLRFLDFGGLVGQDIVSNEGSRLQPSGVHHVMFHRDVPLSVAASILGDHGATVLEPGVEIGTDPRFNFWTAAIPESGLALLAGSDPVVRLEPALVAEDNNNGARTVIGADVAGPAGTFCGGAGCDGTGIVVAQWETRWAPGDTTFTTPPASLPAGGAHGALAGRVTVRDLSPLDPADPPPPPGCAGSIRCGPCTFSDHAAHVAGTILGDGTGSFTQAGMAPAATAVSYQIPGSMVTRVTAGIAQTLCEMEDSFLRFGARLANNSWGNPTTDGAMARYLLTSLATDWQIRRRPSEPFLFAAGNEQIERVLALPGTAPMPAIFTPGACAPTPPGVTAPPAIPAPPAIVAQRFFTLNQGNGQSAKNALVVGAINTGIPSAPGSTGRMTNFSSWGPTQDGRIKPDLVGPGAENNQRDCGSLGCPAGPPISGDPNPGITSTVCSATGLPSGTCLSVAAAYGSKSGTSMSTPAVTGGAALLMQEQAVSGVGAGDAPLDSDSLKALLVHTATDLPAHFPAGGAFMSLQDCDGDGGNDDCWPAPIVAPGTVQDGPDYSNGWGLANIEAAITKIRTRNPPATLRPGSCPRSAWYNNLPFNSPLQLGGDPVSIGLSGCSTQAIREWVAFVQVPAGTTELRVTISWDDLQALVPAAGATADLIVNDLNLIVTPYSSVAGTPTGPHNYSWRLDPACPYLQAVRVSVPSFDPATYADRRNNVEQVVVDTPAAGTWRIAVQSVGLRAPQPFGIAISMPPSWP